MTVIFNVKVSNLRFFVHQRPNLSDFCRADIFKYSIASHAILNKHVSRYIFFIQLDNDLENKKDEIKQFIQQNIDVSKTDLMWHRNNTITDWKNHSALWNNLDDEIIWFAGNDDHIFFDYNLELVETAIKLLEEESNNFAAVYFSHWPEAIRMAFHYHGKIHQNKNFVFFNWENHDSIRIVTKKLFNYYWFGTKADTACVDFYRTDAFNFSDEGKFPIKTFVPTREMCRHFDGYSHVGGLYDFFPPLEIPRGFFESQMIVNYGFEEIDRNVTNINPRAISFKTTNLESGHDMWTILDRLPLFWKNRISKINSNLENDYKFKSCYKNRYIQSLKERVDCHFTRFDTTYHPPEEWILKHLD